MKSSCERLDCNLVLVLKSLSGNTEQDGLVRGVLQNMLPFLPAILMNEISKIRSLYHRKTFCLSLMINKKKKENRVIGVANIQSPFLLKHETLGSITHK